MITVATVLRSGGIYEPKHVEAVQRMSAQYIPEHRFVCLSDLDVPCERIPLEHNWPGWWSKLEVFRLPGPLLYIDLDTSIVGDCSEIVEVARGKEFVAIRDFYRGTIENVRSKAKVIGSGLMFWESDMRWVYEAYKADPHDVPGGDQAFLETIIPLDKLWYWQDLTDGVVSYKVKVKRFGLTASDKIVCFHGNPKPWKTHIPYFTGEKC